MAQPDFVPMTLGDRVRTTVRPSASVCTAQDSLKWPVAGTSTARAPDLIVT